MSVEYKAVYEYSAPTFYDVDTDKELYDECDAGVQCYWVVSWDTEEKEIIEWLERYVDAEEAIKVAKELNEKGE